MAHLIVSGPCQLNGEVEISGSKNEALKLIALAILAQNPVKIENVPRIKDVFSMLEILECMGATYSFIENSVTIDSSKIINGEINSHAAKKLRASIVLLGPCLTRFSHILIPHPGGCLIGARSIETHLDAFKQLGAKILDNCDNLDVSLEKIKNKTVTLKERSVTATENMILYAAGQREKISIKNCATEPEIIDLLEQIKSTGIQINGIGTRSISIKGMAKLNINHLNTMPDRIEAGTFAIAFIATGGKGTVTPYPKEQLGKFDEILQDMGVIIEYHGKSATFTRQNILKPFDISTAPYPELATDLQSSLSLLGSIAKGSSRIHETMFENRLSYLEEMKKMGFNVEIEGKHNAKISKSESLHPTTIKSLDLRSGITLVLAALMTRGDTIIEHIEIVDRGYENIDRKLKLLGAKLERVEDYRESRN